MWLTFKGFDQDKGLLTFNLLNKEVAEPKWTCQVWCENCAVSCEWVDQTKELLNEDLQVSIKYWASNVYLNTWHFKPYP